MIHVRKVAPCFFSALADGRKTFELREEEAPVFEAGDYLALNEYISSDGEYTGRCLLFEITYVLRANSYEVTAQLLPPGVVALGLRRICL